MTSHIHAHSHAYAYQRTIFNQGPAGGGKYGVVDDVFMAAKVGANAKMLRTHPPAWAARDGVAVDALNFSGKEPLQKNPKTTKLGNRTDAAPSG